jgi:hypothetical protein
LRNPIPKTLADTIDSLVLLLVSAAVLEPEYQQEQPWHGDTEGQQAPGILVWGAVTSMAGGLCCG